MIDLYMSIFFYSWVQGEIYSKFHSEKSKAESWKPKAIEFWPKKQKLKAKNVIQKSKSCKQTFYFQGQKL